MPTGRLPTGTSFTSLSSNIRLSFGISLSSRRAVAGRISPRPMAQPRKPPLGFGPRANDEHGNVVAAAAIVGEFDELGGGLVRIGLGLQSAGDFRLGDHAGQTVGAEQQDVAGKEGEIFGVDSNIGL